MGRSKKDQEKEREARRAEFWRRLTTGEIKITVTRLPPEEERRRFKRFMEIIHEIDMQTWRQMTEEELKE